MSDSISHKLPDADSALSSTVTGEVAVASVIIVFMLFVAALILYLRLNGYSGAIGLYTPRPQNPVFAPNQPDIPRKPLDPLVLNCLPVTIFWSEDFKEEGVIKCAVCLSELADGEKARILPDCKHGFHVECIDMWFCSNSTCPLCRSLVRVDNGVEPIVDIPVLGSGCFADSQNSKVSFDEGGSSAGSSFSERRQEGMILIEIPGSGHELSSSSSTPLASGPDVERTRSLRRILSRGNLNSVCVCSACSPGGYDVEQGGRQNGQPVSEPASYS